MNKLIRERRGWKQQGKWGFFTVPGGDMKFPIVAKTKGARRTYAPVWFKGGSSFAGLSCAKGE